VHEHGGEISAFNLHPHGAAVAVELPVDFAIKKSEVAAGDRAYSASV
jgi:K+-sensing histidine kinase KdpD